VHTLAFKMLFRRKGTVSTILAIALLIALLASVNSLMNNVSAQTKTLSQLAGIGNSYIITRTDAQALTDGQIDTAIVDIVNSTPSASYVIPQIMLSASLSCDSGTYNVTLRGVESVRDFCNVKKAVIKGSISDTETQVNVGRILSQLIHININDTVTLAVAGKALPFTVAGIITTSTQSDSEIVLPIKAINILTGNTGTVSFIEFAPKNLSIASSFLNNLNSRLPENIKITQIQQVDAFALDINNQILSFLNLWSIVIYIVVIAASYVVASRLITEASYELSMIKTLGAKRRVLFNMIFTHTLVVAFFGAVLGVAIGIAGAQLAATGLRWVSTSLAVDPFLELNQALLIIALAIIASFIGSLFPALKAAFTTSVEADL